ncbi:Hsc70-interacting protein [Melipona quadrifasciata]|uniref:Hsc70-interacting protein n=1 Tax=Melipona quadrifasciata TaxID=166423 RepID=A0A0N0BHX4_9HYME|nr:Hsc70-interacting protein [Melipona quadrifasciata]
MSIARVHCTSNFHARVITADSVTSGSTVKNVNEHSVSRLITLPDATEERRRSEIRLVDTFTQISQIWHSTFSSRYFPRIRVDSSKEVLRLQRLEASRAKLDLLLFQASNSLQNEDLDFPEVPYTPSYGTSRLAIVTREFSLYCLPPIKPNIADYTLCVFLFSQARKIEEHKRKKARKIQEKLERERQERLKKARESAKAYEENTRTSQTETSSETPGMGDFYKFLNDPDVLSAFQDPEVAEAFKEISTNPTNIFKYQSNPKIMAFINKMASKFGGAGNMPDGFPGMMGGMPGFAGAGVAAGAAAAAGAGAQTTTPKPKPQDDVGLD